MIRLPLCVFLFIGLALPAAAGESSFEDQLNDAQARIEALRAESRLSSEKLQDVIEAARNGATEEGRLDAIRALRIWAPVERSAYAALRDLAASDNESVAIRRRAAQSLGRAIALPNSEYSLTLKTLKALSEDEGVPMTVRAMAIKALYWAPVNESDVRQRLLHWTREGNPQELRMAALWALATVAANEDVRGVLRAAFDASEPDIRLQAFKSLYPQADREELAALAIRTARDLQEDMALRETAVLFLSGSLRHHGVRGTLEAFKSGAEPGLARAAAKALEPSAIRGIWYFFRLRYDPVRHVMIEVLEFE